MTSSLGAGKEILAYCGKCRLSLAHVIMAMSGEHKIHKVQCKTCHDTHTYKDAPAKKRAPATKTGGKTSKTSKSSKSSKKSAPSWSDKMSQTSNFIPYSMKTQYHLGEGIAHPTFGNGIVQETLEHDKISVLFENDAKILIHNKI